MHVAGRSYAELRNTVSVVLLLTVPAFSRQHNWDISATDTNLSILPIVGVSIVCVERLQRRYRRQPTSLVRPERGTTKTIQYYTITYGYSFHHGTPKQRWYTSTFPAGSASTRRSAAASLVISMPLCRNYVDQ